MSHLPYLLPWVRVLLLSRSITSTDWDDTTGRLVQPPSSRIGDASADRKGRLVELDARGRRLRAALAAVLVRADAPELRVMHEWLDTWSSLGLIVSGMTHQGWDLQLTAYAARD